MNAQLSAVPSSMDAYREAAKARDAIVANSGELQARIANLQPLQEKRDTAQAEFDRVMADEAAALAAWAKAGAQGTPPTPDSKARDKAAKALADAEHTLTAAGAAKAELERELFTVNQNILPAQAAVREAMAAVFGDEWLAACKRNADALARLEAEHVRLDLLYQGMHGASPGTAGHYSNIERERVVERLNNPTINPQVEGAAAFEKWCAETFGDASVVSVAQPRRFGD